jgi:hypothetical protein
MADGDGMNVGDEEYRKMLRRFNTLWFLDKRTAKQDEELAHLDAALSKAEKAWYADHQGEKEVEE